MIGSGRGDGWKMVCGKGEGVVGGRKGEWLWCWEWE